MVTEIRRGRETAMRQTTTLAEIISRSNRTVVDGHARGAALRLATSKPASNRPGRWSVHSLHDTAIRMPYSRRGRIAGTPSGWDCELPTRRPCQVPLPHGASW